MSKKIRVILMGDKDVEFNGRLLGLINNIDFAKLLYNMTLWKRLITVETTDLKDLSDNYDDVAGKRVVISKDDSATKKVFVSASIDFLSHVDFDDEGNPQITCRCDGHQTLILKESE